MEQFNLHEWKLRELQKYNNITNGRHTFRATAMQPVYSPEQRLTLADGTVIITPEGNSWIGKPITLEDGTPLPPGEYTIANNMHSSARIIVIGKDGNVKDVREPVLNKGVRNSFVPMNAQEIFHQWRKAELAKLPENRQLKKQAIESISRKLEQIKRETTNLKRDS